MNHANVPPLWRPEVQQAIFRQLLQATAYPGEPQPIRDLIQSDRVAVAILATLCDDEVTFADPHRLLTAEERRFLGGREVDAEEANFILADVDKPPLFMPRRGTIYRPEEAATVILACPNLLTGILHASLSGPGIESETSLRIGSGLLVWLTLRTSLTKYPQGIDLILADATQIISIPRSTTVSTDNLFGGTA